MDTRRCSGEANRTENQAIDSKTAKNKRCNIELKKTQPGVNGKRSEVKKMGKENVMTL